MYCVHFSLVLKFSLHGFRKLFKTLKVNFVKPAEYTYCILSGQYFLQYFTCWVPQKKGSQMGFE